MKDEIITGTIGTIMGAVGTGTQTNSTLQTISLIITIIGGIITYIVVPILLWYNKAKKDGKIDKDEIREGIKTIKDGIDAVQQIADENNKKGDKDD